MSPSEPVIPAKADIQKTLYDVNVDSATRTLDSRFRGIDGEREQALAPEV